MRLTTRNILKKKTTPWEKTNYWGDKLQEFKIDLEKVERVYHISNDGVDEENDNDVIGKCYSFVARMQGGFYVILEADTCECCSKFYGDIFVTRDPNSFMTQLSSSYNGYNNTLVYESMRKDGISFEEEKERKKDGEEESRSF